MTPTEILTLATMAFAIIVPLVTSYVGYRKTMADIELAQKAQNEASEIERLKIKEADDARRTEEEAKRLELSAGAPARDAAASEAWSRTMKTAFESLREELKAKDETIQREREQARNELSESRAARLAAQQQINDLSLEMQKMTIRLNEKDAEINKLNAEIVSLKAIIKDKIINKEQ